jgi:porin
VEREFRFAGHGDYLTNIDIHKLGGPQGQFLQIRAEHRYGESLADATGAFLPPALATDLPTVDSENLYITNLLFTQALSESFAIYAGKLDTLDGDMNAFAHGRGIRQFSNAAFVVNPIGLRTVAYSTLGTGFVFLHEGEPIYNFLVLNARDTTTSDGLSELFAEGAVVSQELRLPTNFFGKPGHQLFGAIWSSREFAALDQSPIVILPSVPIARKSGSWALTYNFDQYLVVDPRDSKKGWGVFGRAGIADPETNPIEYFLSLGFGGNSRLHNRENDTFGLGWYYSGTSNRIAPFLSTVLGNLRDAQGGELFYNIAVNKRLSVTTDSQVIMPARSNVDTSLVFGLRANLTF